MPDYDSRHATSSLSLATEWEVLGPFQIGTRGKSLGSTPLSLTLIAVMLRVIRGPVGC